MSMSPSLQDRPCSRLERSGTGTFEERGLTDCRLICLMLVSAMQRLRLPIGGWSRAPRSLLRWTKSNWSPRHFCSGLLRVLKWMEFALLEEPT